MRYLRHAPLAFWVAVTMLLVGISAAAWYAGKDTTVVVTPMANTGETRSDVKAMIERVSGVYPAITTLDLAVWANETATIADNGLARYLASGGRPDDNTGLAWVAVSNEARALAIEGPTDSSAALAGAARLGSAVQRLAAIVDGLTISAPTGTPATGNTTQTTTPTPATPDRTLGQETP